MFKNSYLISDDLAQLEIMARNAKKFLLLHKVHLRKNQYSTQKCEHLDIFDSHLHYPDGYVAWIWSSISTFEPRFVLVFRRNKRSSGD